MYRPALTYRWVCRAGEPSNTPRLFAGTEVIQVPQPSNDLPDDMFVLLSRSTYKRMEASVSGDRLFERIVTLSITGWELIECLRSKWTIVVATELYVVSKKSRHG